MSKDAINILVVFANPRGSVPLRLGAEHRAIEEARQRALYRERLHLTLCHAATIHDLRRALLEQDYRIVQLSAHGTGRGLVLEDSMGEIAVVPQAALAELFHAYAPPRGTLECVVLNACYSVTQGEIVALGVPYTIAMEGAVEDEAALEFSRGFYDALGAGRSIAFAYEEGCRTVRLAAPDSTLASVFLTQGDAPPTPTLPLPPPVRGPAPARHLLLGCAVDLSGSMTESLNNPTGGQMERLEGVRDAFARLVRDASHLVRAGRAPHDRPTIDLFLYGFGLRGSRPVADLLALLQTGQQVMSQEEIETLTRQHTRELQERYRSYEGLGGLARQWGLGGWVDEAERLAQGRGEAEIRARLGQELARRLEGHLERLGEATLPVEEVAQMWERSAAPLLAAEPLIYGMTPLREVLEQIAARFARERAVRPPETVPLLFLLSDGEPTDGDPLPVAQTLAAAGVTIIACFLTNQDIAAPRVLFGTPDPAWNAGARLMFEMASPLQDASDFARFLLNKGWTLQPNARLFVQVNHSEVLEEFIRVALSPLDEDGAGPPLPRGL